MTFAAVPFVFSPSTLIQSAQVNADFAAVVASGNNIDAAQITTGILPVVRGGTGANTVGGAATAIGAVKVGGDTMTGTLTVPGINYPGTLGHVFAFGWDGANAHVYVDNTDVGIIGDITSVTAGNGLTGGGSSGAVTLALSGSYTGNLNVSGTLTATNAVVNGTLSVLNNVTMAQQLSVAGLTTVTDLTVNNALQCWFGIVYRGINPAFLQIGFNYNASNLDLWVNDGFAFTILSSSSDARLKSNISRSEIDALGMLSRIELSSYDRTDRPNQHFSLGLIAQNVQSVIPEAVVAGPPEDGARVPVPGLLHLDYNPLLACTMRAVQQLAERVERLEETVRSLTPAAAAAPDVAP